MSARTWLLAASLLVMLISACAGSSSRGASADEPHAKADPQQADADRQRQEALAALRARQEAACEQVSVVITDCAVADAHAQLSPEELAELDLDNLAPAHRAEFFNRCAASKMSLRQVKVFEACLADTTCTTFIDCLEQASPRE